VNVPIVASSMSAKDSNVDAAGSTHAAVAEGQAEEHTIVIRVYDRFENMGISKVVVKAPTASGTR